MNAFDIGVVAVIGLSAVFAFARGFVREALSIAAWVGAALVTFYGSESVNTIVDSMVNNPLLSKLISWGGLFIGSLILLTIVTGIVARSVRSSALSPIDRTLGFIFGVLRGVFIVSLAYLVVGLVQPSEQPNWLREAKSVPYLHQGAELISNFLPEKWKTKGTAAAEEIIPRVNSAVEAEKAMRALSNPTAPPTTATPDSSQTPKYDRDQLNRLINNNQR